MSANELIAQLPTMSNQRPLVIFGAAVIDVIADADVLPYRGSDLELHQQSINVGGCALNVAVTIHRLGLKSLNALPIGQGIWSDIIRNDLNKKGIDTIIQNVEGDNGWCLALVEPDGERTFLSFSGVENNWTAERLAQISCPADSLLYLSGYQLVSASAEFIMNWLESFNHNVLIYIDFGPRIANIPVTIRDRLLALNTIITLNRQEAEYVQRHWLNITHKDNLDIEEFSNVWSQDYPCPLVIRVDKEGAYYHSAMGSGMVSAFQTIVVDSIGAGDSHAGGVLAGLASGWSLKDAIELGNAVASFVVSHRGGDCAPLSTELTAYLDNY